MLKLVIFALLFPLMLLFSVESVSAQYTAHLSSPCDAPHPPRGACENANEKKYYPSPLKQFKAGIPIDEIQCKDGLQLVTKASNGNPACVTSHTKETLIQRGWTESQDSFASKILTELRSGSQPITAEQGEFVKKIALMDNTIQEFVRDKTWDFDCCSYLTNNSEPKNLDVVITFFDYDSKKQLEAVMDLQEVRVVKTKVYDTAHLGEPVK